MPPRRNLKPVEAFRFTQLLHDIENLGGRHKVRPGVTSLKNLCDKKVEVFGDFGTNLRRAIQKKFSGIQRLSIEQYIHLLHENGITLLPRPPSFTAKHYEPTSILIIKLSSLRPLPQAALSTALSPAQALPPAPQLTPA